MDHNKLLEIGIKKRNKELTDSWADLADRYSEGLFSDGESFRMWVKNRLRSKEAKINSVSKEESSDIENDKNFKETLEIHKDGTQSSSKLVEMSLEDSKDVNFLLKSHGYDIDIWELISAKSNVWNAYSKKDGTMTLYSSKISVKPRKEELTFESLKKYFAEMDINYQRPHHTPIRFSEDGKMLEVSIADLHLGKLAWDGDAGDTYNWNIARERFFFIINDVLSRTKDYKLEKILFVWSHDFFHYDGGNVTTTAGTRQDTDLKLAQMYKIGTKMLVEAIDLLSQFAPVHTFYVGANHDKLLSYCATEHLGAWFRNDDNVTVDTDPKIRKYFEFGQNLIQFSHGHAEGKRIGELMPVEAREAWGRTSYHEVHAGHFHSEKTITKDNGVIVRFMGSPTGTDTWHYESGYCGAVKKGQSFLWDKENGLELVINTTVK